MYKHSKGGLRSAVGRHCKSVSNRQDIRLGSVFLSETGFLSELDFVRDFPTDCMGKSPLLAVPLFELLSSEGSDSCHHMQSPAKTDRRKRAT